MNKPMICAVTLAAITFPAVAQQPTPDDLHAAWTECAESVRPLLPPGKGTSEVGWPKGWEHCADIEVAWAKVVDAWEAQHPLKRPGSDPAGTKAFADKLKSRP